MLKLGILELDPSEVQRTAAAAVEYRAYRVSLALVLTLTAGLFPTCSIKALLLSFWYTGQRRLGV